MHVISVYKFYKSSLLITMAALPVVHFSTYSGQSVLVHSDHHVSLSKVSTIATLYAFLWDVPWWETCGFGWVDWKSSLSSRPQIWSFKASTVFGYISDRLMSQQAHTNGHRAIGDALRFHWHSNWVTYFLPFWNKIQSWLICADMVKAVFNENVQNGIATLQQTVLVGHHNFPIRLDWIGDWASESPELSGMNDSVLWGGSKCLIPPELQNHRHHMGVFPKIGVPKMDGL